MSTWEEIGEKWWRAQQMGWQAIQAAMDVGDELTQKQTEIPHGDWIDQLVDMINVRRAAHLDPIQPSSARKRANELMRLSLHRELIEAEQPDTMRGALALLPKVPRKVSPKQQAKDQEEADKYESFAKKTAKDQAEVLAKKMVKVELDELQNQAHDAVTKEMKALKRQLKIERDRIGGLMKEADEKQQFYNDLINKRMNGYDYKKGFKALKQALHPDRPEASPAIRKRALETVNRLSQFLQL